MAPCGMLGCTQQTSPSQSFSVKETYLDGQQHRLGQDKQGNCPLKERMLGYVVHLSSKSIIICQREVEARAFQT